MTAIDNYYNILGIKTNASLEDIKKAYRTQAKLLHPDKNKNPDAHEQFVLLNEAHEYFLNAKAGLAYDQKKKTYAKQSNRKRRSYEDWKREEVEKTRARARYYAKMKYEEYVNSDYYNSIESLNIIATHLGFFIAIGALIIFPIIATVLYGAQGLGISIIIDLILLPMIVTAIKYRAPLDLRDFFDSIIHIVKTKSFSITVLILLNIFIILKFGLQTLISPWLLVTVFLFVIGAMYLLNHKQKNSNFYLKTFCIAPLLVNVLLLLNFIASSDPVLEIYRFRNDLEYVQEGGKYQHRWNYQKSTFIYLDDNTYSEFPGIRMFLDIDEMRNKNNIRYTFKNGLLGFRVMSDYEFIY